MYISISGEDRIAIYTVDPKSGGIEFAGETTVAGRPAPIAISPNKKHLYVGQRGNYRISSFQIDTATGSITFVRQVSLESDPCFLSVDRTGRYLLSAYYNAGRIAIHPIDKHGALDTNPTEWLATETGAHSILTDRSNQFAFVPHIADKGPNMILQFKFDETHGTLTPNSPSNILPAPNLGPRHYCFHPNKDILYFSNEQGCSVSAYHLDTSSGTLSHFQTISTLPSGYTKPNTCSQIQITNSGRYLYAPNRGHNSIACFSIDEIDGRLTTIGWTDSEPVPRAFSLDPSDKFLFAAGLDSGKLCSYQIIENTGQLHHFSTTEVGKEPMWVLLTDLTSQD